MELKDSPVGDKILGRLCHDTEILDFLEKHLLLYKTSGLNFSFKFNLVCCEDLKRGDIIRRIITNRIRGLENG